MANLTLATNESYNRDGQRMESTEWHNLEMWDNQANTAEKYMKKGDLLYVEGKIRTDRYTDSEGQERQVRKIRVTSFQMMGSLLSGSPKSNDSSGESATGSGSNEAGEDLPF